MSGSTQNWWETAAPAQTAATPPPQQPSPSVPEAPKPTLPDWAIHDRPPPTAAAAPASPAGSGKWWDALPAAPAPGVSSAPPPQASWSNIAGAIPSGLYSGVSGAANIPTHAVNAVGELLRGIGVAPEFKGLQPPINTNPTNYTPQGGIANTVYNASQAAGSLASMGPAARLLAPLMPAGSAPQIVANAVGNVTPKVVAAGAAGAAAEEPAAEMVPEPYRPIARTAANLAGAAGVAGATGAVENAVRGNVAPETAALAQAAQDNYGIPIRPGQLSDNRIVRTADSALKSVPLSGHADVDAQAQSAFEGAIAREMNVPGVTKITPEVLQQARTTNGGVLQDVENRNNVNFDDTLQNDFANIETNAHANLTEQEFGVVKRQLDNILGTVKPGDTISGETYGNLIHKGSPLDAMTNLKNSNLSDYGTQIRSALRDSLQRSLSPDDAAAYTQARYGWKVMKTIEPLLGRGDQVGGITPSTGGIIPEQLRTVVNRAWPNASSASLGEIPLNDLAKIGQRFLKEPRTSMTSERANVFRWLKGAGETIGAGVVGASAEHFGLPSAEVAIPAALATGATLGIGRGVGAALRSPTIANRMIQSGLGNAPLALPSAEASVPLLTSVGVRQLSPPQENSPPTSTNPTTGLPEYSLKANQEMSARDVGAKLLDGSLASHDDVQNWIGANKPALRGKFGGQGMQNISLVASLLRRAQSEPGAPSTVMSLLANAAPPQPVADAVRAAGASSPADLMGMAIAHPPLARELATRTGPQGRIGRAGQARLAALIAAAQGVANGVHGNSVPGGDGMGNVGVPGQNGQRGNAPLAQVAA